MLPSNMINHSFIISLYFIEHLQGGPFRLLSVRRNRKKKNVTYFLFFFLFNKSFLLNLAQDKQSFINPVVEEDE